MEEQIWKRYTCFHFRRFKNKFSTVKPWRCLARKKMKPPKTRQATFRHPNKKQARIQAHKQKIHDKKIFQKYRLKCNKTNKWN